MKIMNYLKLVTFPALLIAGIITGFSVKKNSEDSNIKSDVRQLPARNPRCITIKDTEREVTSEFFFIPEGETRVWHVINTYSSQFSIDAPEKDAPIKIRRGRIENQKTPSPSKLPPKLFLRTAQCGTERDERNAVCVGPHGKSSTKRP